MDLSTLITTVFCLSDDWLKDKKLRKRGPRPKLADIEVLTIEVVGEFLQIDTDRGLYEYFRRHYSDLFPALGKLHRTTFTRQAANLWSVKERFWQHLLEKSRLDPELSLVDSFPVPVCRFARAYRCRRLPEESAFGRDEMVKQTFYGLRAHLRICWPGFIVAADLAPANVHDLHVGEQLLEGVEGWALADGNYRSASLIERLSQAGLHLLAPPRSSEKEQSPWPRFLVQKRRRIETVIGQLTERYNAKKVWAMDRWHLVNRWLRKILSHTFAVYLCQQLGLSPLRFSELLD